MNLIIPALVGIQILGYIHVHTNAGFEVHILVILLAVVCFLFGTITGEKEKK